jgi:hypothetical protein
MHEFIHMLAHPLEHAAIDCLKLLPLLFAAYLLMEFTEHHMSEKVEEKISKAGRAGPALGALIGLIPQCGFSGAAASLYSGRVITLGTLISVFLATSDEMLPILIASQVDTKLILTILAFKLIFGIIAGYIIDLLFRRRRKIDIDALCERERCSCGKGGIFASALLHTVKIALFLFAVTFVLELIMENGGQELFENSVLSVPFIGEMLTALIGLIPNCASSVVITNLYLENAIPFGAMLSGLLVNCGIGLLVLFRVNKGVKENISVTVLLYGVGVVLGFIGGVIASIIPIF